MIGLAAATQLVRSFEGRNFRYLWFSDLLNGWAEQMEFVVLAWFVLTETDSPFLVGIYGSLRFGGTLFSPFYGIIADRYDRKKIFIIVRSTFPIFAAIVLYLSLTERLEVSVRTIHVIMRESFRTIPLFS